MTIRTDPETLMRTTFEDADVPDAENDLELQKIQQLVEQADAEVAEAEAVLAATRARAKVTRLRESLARAQSGLPVDDSDLIEIDDPAAAGYVGRQTRWRLPDVHIAVRLMSGILCVVAIAGCGYLSWQHHQLAADEQRQTEFINAAREGISALTSLDFNHAQEDIDKVLEHATGDFERDFQARGSDFAKVVLDSKVVTRGTVHSAALQTMTDDSAVVLVAATSQVTNNAGADKAPRAWRLSVSVAREGGQYLISDVEFVP